VCILQRIADEDTVLIGLEDGLSFQHYATYAINRGGHYVTRKLTDVLVTLRAVVVALILVETEVELSTVLNDRTVERREQNVVLIVEFRHGNNEQTVIFTGVTVYQCRGAVGSRAVRSKQFTTERLLQVCHDSFF
jgi:hypothetical protein